MTSLDHSFTEQNTASLDHSFTEQNMTSLDHCFTEQNMTSLDHYFTTALFRLEEPCALLQMANDKYWKC